ncbi:MAG: tRNA preQ1(34) S-adenosylmethionine ribosyltransferase-isomerase QueA [Gammaproteobacteria bacterium]
MQTSDFDYALPPEQIAQYPLAARRDARLLAVAAGAGLSDLHIPDVVGLLRPDDLLVLNDTRVIPARLFGRKATGGAVEILIERCLDERRALAHVRASKSPRAGMRIEVEGGGALVVLGRAEDLFELEALDEPLEAVLARSGRVPLPPYITRGPEALDVERYQTVWASRPGAVAAPTAGLHLDEALLEAITAAGVRIGRVTLHVGAGTFQQVRDDDIERHMMHAERYEVPAALCEAVAAARARGGRVVAVGTTVVRALESAALDGALVPGSGDTRLFIRAGFEFRVIDALLTNFHLPRSTLLMLVTAFGGYERVMQAYRHAVAAGYRFFSYGDAMWLERDR